LNAGWLALVGLFRQQQDGNGQAVLVCQVFGLGWWIFPQAGRHAVCLLAHGTLLLLLLLLNRRPAKPT